MHVYDVMMKRRKEETAFHHTGSQERERRSVWSAVSERGRSSIERATVRKCSERGREREKRKKDSTVRKKREMKGERWKRVIGRCKVNRFSTLSIQDGSLLIVFTSLILPNKNIHRRKQMQKVSSSHHRPDDDEDELDFLCNFEGEKKILLR